MCVPNEGLLGDIIKKSVTKFYSFDDEKITINDNLTIKTEPMIGVIGVAPAEGEVETLSPGDHGGNMDTTLIREGSTVYLPVNVKGAFLGVGDLHAAMGDGESWYMGLEVSGEVELDISVRKDLKLDIPFVKTEEKFASLASELGTDDALKKAMLKLLNFMVDNGNIDFETAGFISSLCGNLEISQVVDPLKTVRMSIPTYVLEQIGVKL
jgi:amidase